MPVSPHDVETQREARQMGNQRMTIWESIKALRYFCAIMAAAFALNLWLLGPTLLEHIKVMLEN